MALFITFEGLDGSGKSTHLRRAEGWLRKQKVDVIRTHEPGGTPLGEALRAIFLDPRWDPVDPMIEALLVFASRRQHLLEVVEPALHAGRHVLCDRFTDSSLAYQGSGRGLPRPWIEKLDRLVTAERRPDHTLLFDLTPEAALERRRSSSKRQAGRDRFDDEELAFHRRVGDGYHELVRRDPERFHVLDAGGPELATWRQVEGILRALLEI